ncbi:hypothetical protein ACR77J_17540 [Tissierella praeacuta]|uniref:hypothetical protein n=1 Tax=Tissierella praeacuta TaxID=43131 RepID=UPI003DA57321
MNCKKCNFYCYDDEYICPNCESFLERELPIDEYERSLFIYNKMLEFKERKRAIKIIKISRRFLLIVLISGHFIFGWWLDTFITYPNRIDSYQNTARWTIVFALAFYIIFLGKPSIPSGKPYMEGKKFNKPIGLINKSSIKKSTHVIIISLIFILTYLFYLTFLKKMFLSGFMYWPSSKLESFGIDKIGIVIDIRYFIQCLIIGIYYGLHPIYNITDVDYYLLNRINSHNNSTLH